MEGDSSTRSSHTGTKALDGANQMVVREWLSYIPVFIDFSQLDSFASWLRTEIQDNALSKVLSEVEAARGEAWISPDFMTRINEIRMRRPGFDVELRIGFRLRTLYLEIMCWKSKTKMQIVDAFDEMRKAEEEFAYVTERWGRSTPVCNILVVDPFYDSPGEAKEWMTGHAEELGIFPVDCRAKASYTTSLSKLIEKEEKLPFLVTNIRDHAGIERRILLLCGISEQPDDPQSYSRVRWVFFSTLFAHVLERAISSVLSIKEQMSELEAGVLKESHEQMKEDDAGWSMETLRAITDNCRLLFNLENELALASDDIAGVERNLSLISVTTGSQGISDEKVSEEKVSGNVNWISSPESSVGYGRSSGEEPIDDSTRCDLSYCCALCETREGRSHLFQNPPLNRGVVDETHTLVKMLAKEFSLERSYIERSMGRVKSFISRIQDILSARVNLELNLLQSRTSSDQKAILSKMESILEESAKDRKATEDATKAVEILSLLFASFVLGEISSNFIIWGMQQIWPSNNVPWFAYVGGFLLAVAIAGSVFLLIYLSYLKRKWERRA